MNNNTEYEILTQEIYQSLINAEGISNITVQHNIKLQGRSTQMHQIDVYWEYEIAGIKHKVAIECKNYNKKVSIAKIRDFYGVLADLNNVNGIIVTKVGYQTGAKTYAENYGIDLMELRTPIEADWEGRVKTISINLGMIIPKFNKLTPILDHEWIKENIKFTEDDPLELRLSGMTDEIFIYKADNTPIANISTLENNLPHNWEKATGLVHTYEYDDAYLHIDKIGRIKIKGIKFEYDILGSTENLDIDGESMTKAVLKNTKNGSIKFIDNEGKIK